MEVLEKLVVLFTTYSVAVSFIAGLLTEDFLFFLFFIAGTLQNFNDLLVATVFGFLGVVMHDVLIYWFARTRTFALLNKKLNKKQRHKKIAQFIEKMGRGSSFFPLVVSKFVYGTRVPVLLYVMHKEKKVRFFIMNLLAIAVWFSIGVPAGWLAGQGFVQFLGIMKDIEKLLLVLVVFAFLVYVLNKSIRRLMKWLLKVMKKGF